MIMEALKWLVGFVGQMLKTTPMEIAEDVKDIKSDNKRGRAILCLIVGLASAGGFAALFELEPTILNYFSNIIKMAIPSDVVAKIGVGILGALIGFTFGHNAIKEIIKKYALSTYGHTNLAYAITDDILIRIIQDNTVMFGYANDVNINTELNWFKQEMSNLSAAVQGLVASLPQGALKLEDIPQNLRQSLAPFVAEADLRRMLIAKHILEDISTLRQSLEFLRNQVDASRGDGTTKHDENKYPLESALHLSELLPMIELFAKNDAKADARIDWVKKVMSYVTPAAPQITNEPQDEVLQVLMQNPIVAGFAQQFGGQPAVASLKEVFGERTFQAISILMGQPAAAPVPQQRSVQVPQQVNPQAQHLGEPPAAPNDKGKGHWVRKKKKPAVPAPQNVAGDVEVAIPVLPPVMRAIPAEPRMEEVVDLAQGMPLNYGEVSHNTLTYLHALNSKEVTAPSRTKRQTQQGSNRQQTLDNWQKLHQLVPALEETRRAQLAKKQEREAFVEPMLTKALRKP